MHEKTKQIHRISPILMFYYSGIVILKSPVFTIIVEKAYIHGFSFKMPYFVLEKTILVL